MNEKIDFIEKQVYLINKKQSFKGKVMEYDLIYLK